MDIKNNKNFKNIAIVVFVAIMVCCGIFYVNKSSTNKMISQNNSIVLKNRCYKDFDDKVQDVKLKEKWAQEENNAIYYSKEDDFGFILPKEIFDCVKVSRSVSKDGKNVYYTYYYVDDLKKKEFDLESVVNVAILPKEKEFYSGLEGEGEPNTPCMIKGDKAYYIYSNTIAFYFEDDEDEECFGNFCDLDYNKRFFTSKDFKSNDK